MLVAFNPGSSYQWSTGSDYSMLNVCNTGTYWVNVSNGMCNTSDTIQVTVHPKPNVNISMVTGSSATLDAGHPGASHYWSTGATTQTIAVNTAGSYWVQVTNGLGCTGSDTTYVAIAALSEQSKGGLPFSLYPNPSQDHLLTLRFEGIAGESGYLRIVNMLGVQVYNEKLDVASGRTEKPVHLQELPAGMYLAELHYSGRRSVIKIRLE